MSARAPKRQWSTAVPLVAAAFAHAIALRNGFVLDDFSLLVNNPYVRTFAGLKELLRSSLFAAAGDPMKTDYYRPAASALNWLSWQLFKSGHAGQHGLNVALHVGVTALIFDVMQKSNVRRDVALVVATLFAIHPATADIVAYVGGRQDMLGWLFVLGGLRFLLTTKRLAACAAIGALAMALGTFSREAFLAIAATLPFAAAFRPSDGTLDRNRGLATAAGCGVGFGIVSLARSAVNVHWNQPGQPHGVGDWIEAAGGFLARMLKDLLAPTDLAVDLDTPKLGVPLALVLLVLFVASMPLAWRALGKDLENRRPLLVFGHLSLFATVVIHTPVALRFGFISDRYAYPFVASAALALAPLAERATGSLAKKLEASPLLRILPKVPWLVVVALIPLTWSRVASWHDESALQRDMYAVRPDDPHSKLAEGSRLLANGEAEKALPLCQAYADRYPRSSRPELCVGLALRQLGRTKEAGPHLTRYAKDHLGNLDARMAAIDTMFLAGDLDGVDRTLSQWESEDEGGAALAKEPDMIAARKELARRRGLPPQKQ